MAKFTKSETLDVRCPNCQSESVHKHGVQTGSRRYRCIVCKRVFRHEMPSGRRAKPEVIGAAIDMYFDGISYKRVAENLSTTFGIPEPSKQSVFAWIWEFPRKAEQAIKRGGRKPATSDEWVAEEMQVDVGGKPMWLWNVMDSKTRFLLATHLPPHRPATEARVTANGVSLWTATQGVGPPVLLCHGGPGVYDYLGPVARMIHDAATAHRYDQRGCGRSEDKPPCDISTFVQDIDALRTHWGYESWSVIGHSWGAALGLLYAARYPERVRRLVYLSGVGVDPAWHAAYRQNRAAKLSPYDRERLRLLDERRRTGDGAELARVLEARADLLRRTEYHDAARIGDIPRFNRFPINYRQNAALGAELKSIELAGNLPARIRTLRTPTLILDGDSDPRPRWARAQLAALLPNARHVTIPRAGHEPWVERPQATAAAIRRFLQEAA